MSRIAHTIAIAILMLLASLVVPLTGCGAGSPDECPPPPAPVELGTFPYHPLVYHLDLSVLAYQLHGQALVWPFDPFYEERAQTLGSARDDFMAKVHAWALNVQGPAQVAAPDGVRDDRGPGSLTGFENNLSHDPILFNYSRIHPWASCVINAAGVWTEYLTPRQITARIAKAFVAYRPVGAGPDAVAIEELPARPGDRDADAADTLLAFEGGTGGKGDPIVGMTDHVPSQSIMGLVLLRTTGPATYDVHIAFRGSRSGKATRAFFEALSTDDPEGNPDWITDLGWRQVVDADISLVGEVARGFALSVRSMLPTIFACLQKAAMDRGTAPTNIYVTGHSLGGGLAQHFTSAVLLGGRYGPDGVGPAMPAVLRSWPWQQIKLVTFSAPRSGSESWARMLTTTGLDSEYWDAGFGSYDDDALPSTGPEIAPRLLDAGRPAGFRALITNDPITSGLLVGGGPVGKTVYVNKGCGDSDFALPDTGSHEPEAVRAFMLAATGDARTPGTAIRYQDMTALNPTRDGGARGSRAEFEKLRDAILRYYTDRGLWFDSAGFLDDFNLMLALE